MDDIAGSGTGLTMIEPRGGTLLTCVAGPDERHTAGTTPSDRTGQPRGGVE